MKKINIILAALFAIPTLNAQDIDQTLNFFSQSEIRGTARFRALSGAFGALGGDLSAVSINPAGSSVFNKSHASFSVNINDNTNDAVYFNGNQSVNDSGFNLNQGGAALVFKSRNPEAKWKKFTVGLAYDRTRNLDNQWAVLGTNNQVSNNFDNTIASDFFDFADGLRLADISGQQGEPLTDAYIRIGGSPNGFNRQQAFLGFESGILEPGDILDDDNTEYFLNLENGNFTHDYSNLETGYNGKIAFNFSGQYGDNVYLGVNLNSHFIDYEQTTSLLETNDNGGAITSIDFRNVSAFTGNGFSLQLGGIFKLNKSLRLGVTYDSPTWLNVRSQLVQFLDTNTLVDAGQDPIDPRVINEFSEIKIKTPSKVSGSLAYVFGKQGLLSFDYSRKDFGNAELKESNNEVFKSEQLTAVSTYRFGGEYVYEQFSFRGGYRFEDSPYENGQTVGDLNGYSLGVGYNFGNTRFDITFDQSNQSFQNRIFNQPLLTPVSIDRKISNITLSLAFDL